jgi:hypothetical protein
VGGRGCNISSNVVHAQMGQSCALVYFVRVSISHNEAALYIVVLRDHFEIFEKGGARVACGAMAAAAAIDTRTQLCTWWIKDKLNVRVCVQRNVP